jgi:hypothetical protein
MTRSLRTLLTGLIDYAGLFPPASLDMRTTVRNFALYRDHPQGWMLSRLIIPAGKLEEFEREAARMLPTEDGADPWRLSALLPPASDADLDDAYRRIAEFNDRHEPPSAGQAIIDSVEIKVTASGDIDRVVDETPEGLRIFFEIPTAGDPRGLIAALAGFEKEASVAAKVRTGGVTPESFPSPAELARFLGACAAAHVTFKATAGLHHPVRHFSRELGTDMHGFFNVFLAAIGLDEGEIDEGQAIELLDERNPHAFHFTEECAAVGDCTFTDGQLALGRERFALSFGSCSFDEPVEDLRSLGLLE